MQVTPQDLILLAFKQGKKDTALDLAKNDPAALVSASTLAQYQGMNIYHFVKTHIAAPLSDQLMKQFDSYLQSSSITISKEAQYTELLTNMTKHAQTSSGKLIALK